MTVRTAAELAAVDEPAWPTLSRMLGRGGVEVVPPPAWSLEVLYRLQVTVRSTLGALALHTGGVLVDGGWLRILGGGGSGLPDLASVNGLGEPGEDSAAPSVLVVAYDVLGGTFAINGGGLSGPLGDVHWFAPDVLDWVDLGFGQAAFLEWAVSGGAGALYDHLRWPGWYDEIGDVRLDEGLSVYPPLWSQEGRDVASASRTPVALGELVDWHFEMAARMTPVEEDDAAQSRGWADGP
ncbi:DUF2625 family protein [Cellulosimicrobium marinum]|uniref:DUF2625 family protein n=1 Tax=Cellulosimicrobium marinum TaxID=1638992 RepID=UPI001E4F998C|nr:DUF2625 family protein [Cellulosimicrobium marinum]MCB7136273.1 DUF2625 domain-containing protein [Cellulosimicrobium marinum]